MRTNVAEPLTDAYLLECEQAARRFSGAYTGTSGTLAGYVILLLKEVRRLKDEAAVERAKREETQRTAWMWPFGVG
jgi:hypothetical protein